MEIISKIKDKLQSRKFWLVATIFVIVCIFYFAASWILTVIHIIGESTTIKIFDLGTSVLNTIIITYCAVNVTEKAMNGEGILGKLLNKKRGNSDD